MTYLGLKDVLRQGWVNAGVQSPESVAAHSWGMAILALKLCPANLNLEHVLKLCLVHDLPEVIVGDLTPQDDVSAKSADERAAMERNLNGCRCLTNTRTNPRLKLCLSVPWTNWTWPCKQKCTCVAVFEPRAVHRERPQDAG